MLVALGLAFGTRVLHLAVDGLSSADVKHVPTLVDLQATAAYTHHCKAEPYTDSLHGW